MTREEANSILYRIAEYFKEWDGSTPAPTMELNIDELRQIASMNVERCSLREALRQERPKGRWIEVYDLDYLKFIWSCDQCGEDAPTKPETCDQILKPFCPNCGAEMEM